MPPDEGSVQANGLRLHYWEWGDPGRPPAVLLHATGFLARLWEPVAEALSERFHVYAYDSRGHGDSDKPPSGYHWANFVDDLRGFLDALDLKRAVVVGHSGGGAAAAYVAATAPERIWHAVLIEPIIVPRQAEDDGVSRRNELADGARRRRMVWSSTDELLRSYRRRPAFAGWREDVLRLYAEHGTRPRPDGQVELKCPGDIEAQVFEHSASLDVGDVLPRIGCPTLVMRGEHTDPYLTVIADTAAGRIPRGRLVTIEDAGHLAPMERPEAVAEAILAFCREAGPP
ncbi:MAG TPA: alpha/beta hydrolase [Dehalococcoidia bacterium]|nr:alpha/beta hydrolase [Dehalococcoidia bacterium]